ncbi:MAG: hypothetical protein V1668_01520 [Patescibacteria group bacterium]
MNEQTIGPLIELARSGKIIVRSGTHFLNRDWIRTSVLALIVDGEEYCTVDMQFWFHGETLECQHTPPHAPANKLEYDEKSLADRLRFICHPDIALEKRQVAASLNNGRHCVECSPFSPHLLICYTYLLKELQRISHQPEEGHGAVTLYRRFDAFVGEQISNARKQGAFVQFA